MPGLEATITAAREAAEGGGGTPKNEPAIADAEEVISPEEPNTTEPEPTAESINTEDAPIQDEKEDEPVSKRVSDSIPYARFKEVNDLYRAENRRNSDLSNKLESIQEQLRHLNQPKDTGPQLDDNQKQVKEYYLDPVLGPITKQLKAIQDDLLASKESVKLEKTLTGLSDKYPVVKNVPMAREILENRYIMSGGRQDLEETAAKLQKYFTERDKKTITDYLGGKKTAAATGKGATPPGKSPAFQPKKLPKTASFEERMDFANQQVGEKVKLMDE